MDLRNILYEDINWIQLPQRIVQWSGFCTLP